MGAPDGGGAASASKVSRTPPRSKNFAGRTRRASPPGAFGASGSTLADNLPAVAAMATKKPLPYWLSGVTEPCDLCEQPHVLQSLRRCAACDRASCEHCVTVDPETGDILCHECAGEAGEETG